jgi:hypothetical protein
MPLIGIYIGAIIFCCCVISVLLASILDSWKEMKQKARIDALLDASRDYTLFGTPASLRTHFSGNSHQRRLARRQQARAAKLGNA